MRRMWLALLAAALAGCPSDDPPSCVTVNTACTPLYEPIFANVYTTTLRNGCGSALSACHARGGAGNMSLEDPTTAHQSLLAGRVRPGDPGCSEMIVRVVGAGKDYLMPPGNALSEAERCALIRWIDQGALGPATVAAEGAP